jgi:hypothetical protein
MAYMHPAAIEHQRKRWERADAYRFAAPGTPEAKMPGTLHPWAEVARQEQMAADEARARAAAEQDEFEREVLRLRHDFAKLKLEYELRRFQQKYSPDQPRVPAGNSDGGQWTSGGGSGAGHDDGGAAQTLSEVSDGTRPGDDAARIRLAGGLTDDQLNLTVQTFVSTYCLGSINRQLPGQFMGVTIADVMAEAQRGNAAARMCLKLLMQDRFRK